MAEHRYFVGCRWTPAVPGTLDYRSYTRDFELSAQGKPVLAGSSDPQFMGKPERWNPEELQVGALSACHMLWYLHLCSANGVCVLGYDDEPEGRMTDTPGEGRFLGVTLRPRVIISSGSPAETAMALHSQAHRECFIANSMNFPVQVLPTVEAGPVDSGAAADGLAR